MQILDYSFDSWFFTKGQIIETFRGKGIYQKAIDTARAKLDEGRWVSCSAFVFSPLLAGLPRQHKIHIFPEGKIKQDTLHELRRFKWGVSRMLMESKAGKGEEAPLIIPIWIKGELEISFVLSQGGSLTQFLRLPSSFPYLGFPFPLALLPPPRLPLKGFEEVMNEEREFPRFLPRTGKKVTVIIGEPINDAIEPLLAEYQRKFPHPWLPITYGRDVQEDLKEEPPQLAEMRSKIAEAMRQELRKLGQKVAEVEARPPTKIEWNW